MAVYKRGKTYYYEFQFNGARIQQSALMCSFKEAVLARGQTEGRRSPLARLSRFRSKPGRSGLGMWV
jgi:hypothetical protein